MGAGPAPLLERRGGSCDPPSDAAVLPPLIRSEVPGSLLPSGLLAKETAVDSWGPPRRDMRPLRARMLAFSMGCPRERAATGAAGPGSEEAPAAAACTSM
jgi:hypothetical protein